MSMQLPRAGKEFATWTVETIDTLTGFEVQLVDGGDWLTATYADGQVKLLVCGPDCADKSQATTITTACQPTVRCIDNPEIVIRQDGWITLV